MSRHWYDIGFNFIICGNGMIFEGRGAGVMGTHTRGYNSRSIMIALIGQFNETIRPPDIMMDHFDILLEALINAKIVSHRCLLLAKSYISEDPANPKHIMSVIRQWNVWNTV